MRRANSDSSLRPNPTSDLWRLSPVLKPEVETSRRRYPSTRARVIYGLGSICLHSRVLTNGWPTTPRVWS